MPQAAIERKRAPRKTERVDIRLTAEDKAKVSRAAELSGTSVTEFSTTAARDAADRVLQEHEVIRLSAADREVVVQALMHPRPLNAKLQAAARRHAEFFGG